MARKIVTQELVTETAEAIVAEGTEPSLLAVQSRLGGGSFSTVKRYIDAWKQQRAQAAPDAPPEVDAKGLEFARTLWVLASQKAKVDADSKVSQAHAELTAVRGELSEATNEISRLEAVEAELRATIEQQHGKIRETELALIEAQTIAQRAAALDQMLTTTRAELDAARKEATQQSVAAARASGEVDALGAQLRELTAALKPSKSAK